MDYLVLDHVSKTYGEKVLFENISLKITEGQRIALVAKNGAGKSTMLRVIAGVEKAEGENATVFLHKSVKIGYLKQEPDFNENQTVLETLFDANTPQAIAYKAYSKALSENDNAALEEVMTSMDDLKAWGFDSEVHSLLNRVNLTNFDQYVHELSGGQKKRLALAKIILEEPSFLILDEPTNHLDLEMIEWLEVFLQKNSFTIFMVTHDRYFLENVCNTILELNKGKLHTYKGSYSDYLEKKTLRIENEAVVHDKSKKLLSKELEWVRKMPKARGTKAKSRVDSFHELKERTSNYKVDGKVQIEMKAQRIGKKIIEVQYVSKKFGDFKIVDNFHYNFKKRERVGIIGPNGVGKTTFLKLLTQEIKPDQGKVVVGGTIVFGYYTQDGFKSMKLDRKVIEVVQDIAEYIPLEGGAKITASQLCDRFLFDKKQQQVYVSQLSGGERRRLFLLTILIKNPNFLILDEPTNDLDVITMNVLENFLMEFQGCLIVVTHDRYFMDKIVDHLFIFEGEGIIRDFNGTYTDYQMELNTNPKKKTPIKNKKTIVKTIIDTSKVGLTREQRKDLRRLDKKIEKLENRKLEINRLFTVEPMMAVEKLEKLSKELKAINEELEVVEIDWLELSDLE